MDPHTSVRLPEVKGETTEETVGGLFDEWWALIGSDLFVDFCREKGLPVLDAGHEAEETLIEETKQLHDTFFEKRDT